MEHRFLGILTGILPSRIQVEMDGRAGFIQLQYSEMTDSLAQTPLYQWHTAKRARMVDFSGWSMPVHYKSIVQEHHATRQRVTLFDVSHMGRFRLDGTGAAALLDRLVTRKVGNLRDGQIRYGCISNQSGGILDDVLVYRLVDLSGASFHWLVVNAGNRGKIWAWIQQHRQSDDRVQIADQTTETAMIAIQGPRARAVVARMLGESATKLAYYRGIVTSLMQNEIVLSRTGYTGEDGFEVIVPARFAMRIWELLLDRGERHQITAAGLGARDTLRLEAAMPLYGHELNEEINPIQAGLSFAVDLEGRRFIGCDAIRAHQDDMTRPRRVGLVLEGRRAAREDYQILSNDQVVGHITSGSFSPTLDRPIAMGYVRRELSETGTHLKVDIRGNRQNAEVVDLPFYRRKKVERLSSES